jgi:transcriptional regulator with XRE-family HTH domain
MSKRSDPVDKHVGNRIRVRRVMLGMSQTTLGKALGVAFQQVQKYEAGKNRVSASRLHQIAQTLQVPGAPYFFEGAPGAPRPTKNTVVQSAAGLFDFIATAEGLEIAKALAQIKRARLRRSIVSLVECLEAQHR